MTARPRNKHADLAARGPGNRPAPVNGEPRQITVVLAPDTIAALDRLAERHRCRRADEIRAAVDAHITYETSVDDAA